MFHGSHHILDHCFVARMFRLGGDDGGAVMLSELTVEGTNSYGSSIRRILTHEKISVVEVKPPRKKVRNGIGTTDHTDAVAAAMSVLGEDIDTLLHPAVTGCT